MCVRRRDWIVCALLSVLAGCATAPEPAAPVIDADETLVFLDAGIRPETLLFPEYLMLGDFELDQHGRIPGTPLIGAHLISKAELGVVRRRYNDVLAPMGWHTDQLEVGRNSFRILASGKDGELEIRAVQGSGATEVFILFTPLETR